MTAKNHFAALQEIRNWSIDDVTCALKNNGLSECIDACKKRDVTGEKLLELSEVKLGLWKRDLTIVNIRKLAAFIQDISKMPARYSICSMSSHSDDAWDTDFDDDEMEENSSPDLLENNDSLGATSKRNCVQNSPHEKNGTINTQNSISENFNSIQQNDHHLSLSNKSNTTQLRNKINIPSAFSSVQTSENRLSNTSLGKVSKPPFLQQNGASDFTRDHIMNEFKNVQLTIPPQLPGLHSNPSMQENAQSTLPKPPAFDKKSSVLREIRDKFEYETDLMDEYESIGDDLLSQGIRSEMLAQLNSLNSSPNLVQQHSNESLQKPSDSKHFGKDVNQHDISASSTTLQNHQHISSKNSTLSQQSPHTDPCNGIEKMKNSPNLPPELIKKQEDTSSSSRNLFAMRQEKLESVLRSPVHLPPRNNPHFTSTLLPTHMKNHRRRSEEMYTRQNSPSRISREIVMDRQENENEHLEEVYESIPEYISSKRGEKCEYSDGYLLPKALPLLPPKAKPTLYNIKSSEKTIREETNTTTGGNGQLSDLPKYKNQQKTHQEKNSQNTHVSESPRPSASRPLPPPPVHDDGSQRVVKIPIVQMPWYFNVDRTRGEEILRNCEDGTFMIRPSTKTQNALTLTLKYGKRSFNICVRLRPDGRFALGTAKPTEQTFSSVEELINHYTSNELLLYSNGKQAGIVVLTSPPKKDLSQ